MPCLLGTPFFWGRDGTAGVGVQGGLLWVRYLSGPSVWCVPPHVQRLAQPQPQPWSRAAWWLVQQLQIRETGVQVPALWRHPMCCASWTLQQGRPPWHRSACTQQALIQVGKIVSEQPATLRISSQCVGQWPQSA